MDIKHHWALAILLLVTNCNQEKLPPETQSGNNTFACKVNGKVWIPNGGPGFMGDKAITGGYYEIPDTPPRVGIELTGSMKNGERVSFFLNGDEEGNYKLNEETSVKPFNRIPKNYGYYYKNDTYFVTDTKYTGEVTITHSGHYTDGIIAGTFSFKAVSVKDPSQVVEITNGRFDINIHK
ncbi:DUF6252 family protein [Siphonobacter sp. SORGH_AS_0500]|uniref:DUF6252 family protein n=1 Tax=Siphonobacter sp. SORGH_AS_0500 TaxID=1864824 RepID=UPI0028589F91|nr:DUF6252 family protein [Siphonobacter sp. SORGH_AS_0500]MDR6196409.1 hypothetical protein [Siphonobacter sp. SORGH_AS_0500]